MDEPKKTEEKKGCDTCRLLCDPQPERPPHTCNLLIKFTKDNVRLCNCCIFCTLKCEEGLP
jgi:hypothetical protein